MEESQGVRREIKDVFYLMALQGLGYIAPLIVLPYLMVVLGAEKFGYIGFSLSVCSYLMIVIDFGFNFTATKRVALVRENRDELNRVFSTTLFAKIGLLAVSYLLLLGISTVPQFAAYRTAMLVTSLMMVGNAFLFTFLFLGLGEIRVVSIVNIVAKLSVLPLTFCFVKSPDDYLTAAFLQGFVSVLAAAISIAFLWRKKWVSVVSVEVKNVREAVSDSFPLFLSEASSSVYVAGIVIILGVFASSEDVGRYSAADRITRAALYLVLSPVWQSFYPKLSRMATTDRPQAMILYRKIYWFVAAFMLALSVALFFFSSEMLQFLGKDYQAAGKLFRIFAFIPMFIGLGGVAGRLGLLAMGGRREKKNVAKVYYFAAVIALVSAFFTMPLWQAEGAALSLFVTELFVCLAMIFQFKKANKKPQAI